MSRPSAHEHRPDAFTEFAEELRMLAETVLERVEPTLRSAAEDRPEWSSCSWCPVCATAALVRGEHHDVLTALADHGTAIVTVLREALAGAPVEPVMPEDDGPHHSGRDHDGSPAGRAPGHDSARPSGETATGSGTGHPGGGPESGDSRAATDLRATSAGAHAPKDTAPRSAEARSEGRPGGVGDPSRSARRGTQPRKRSGYTDIPVTIRT